MTIAAPNTMLGGFNLWDFTRAVKASDLPPALRHLLHVMALTPAQGSNGVCAGPAFSYPRLAEATGYGRSTTARYVSALVKAQWVDRISNGPGLRNSYRLRTPSEVIHNPSQSGPGSSPDPSRSGLGTRPAPGRDPSRSGPPDLSLPLLTKIPSIVEGVRARVRAACPDLQPDDDDLAALIQNLETRPRTPVRNVAAYLQTCPPADIRRLVAEAREPQPAADVTPTPPRPDEPEPPECVHGYDGGLTKAGTPRCPVCRRIAAQLASSQPFRASLDEGDRTSTQRAAESLSGPISVGVTA